MNDRADEARNGHSSEYRDVTATEFKRAFGETIEEAIRGRRVRVTRHGRARERIVILREAELDALEARVRSPLDELRAEFDALVERMQSPEARTAAASIGTATSDELADAAVNGPARR